MHGVDDILMPEKAVPAARAEVADAQIGNAAQPLHLFPEPGLGARIKNVELQFAQVLERGARFQLADLRRARKSPTSTFRTRAPRSGAEFGRPGPRARNRKAGSRAQASREMPAQRCRGVRRRCCRPARPARICGSAACAWLRVARAAARCRRFRPGAPRTVRLMSVNVAWVRGKCFQMNWSIRSL